MNRHVSCAAFALAALAGAPAFAAPQGYVTGTVGVTQYDIDCGAGERCDKSSGSGRIIGGWEFAPTWAAELSYADLGDSKVTDSTGELKFKSNYVGVGVAWRPAFNRQWGGVARLGAAFVKSKIDATGYGNLQSKDSTQAYLGLGVTYALTRQWSLEADWNHVNTKFGDDIVTNAGTYSLTSSSNSLEIGGTFHF